MKIIYSILFIILLILSSGLAMKNPSAVYCEEMGYTFEIEETVEGQRGLCVLPDDSKVSAWEFLRGEVGKDYNYCTQQGYESKTIRDGIKCGSIVSSSCNVCLVDEEEVEVTKLMELDFSTSFSGEETSEESSDTQNNLDSSNENPEVISDNSSEKNSKLKWFIIFGLGGIILIFIFLIFRKK